MNLEKFEVPQAHRFDVRAVLDCLLPADVTERDVTGEYEIIEYRRGFNQTYFGQVVRRRRPAPTPPINHGIRE